MVENINANRNRRNNKKCSGKIVDNISTIALENNSPKTVNLVIKSVAYTRGSISPSDIKININLPVKAPEGERFIEYDILRDAIINKPFRIKILSADPPKLLLKIDRRETKELPVAARFTGALSEDYAYGEVSVNPPVVTVSGPKSKIENLKKLYTQPILLDSSINQSFEKRIPIYLEDFKSIPENVLVSVEIYQKTKKKIFSGLPIFSLTPLGISPPLTKVHPTNVDVTVSGPVNSIYELKSSDIIPFLYFSGENRKDSEKNYEVKCYIAKPDIKLISISPEKVNFIDNSQ